MSSCPAVSTTRVGELGFHIIDAHGRQYPIEGCLIWLVSHAVQQDPPFWSQPDEFVDPDNSLHHVKGPGDHSDTDRVLALARIFP